MSLLTPWFLLGLGALSVPILLHLTRRRARQVVDFPSLMFLSQVPYRSLRRRRLEHLTLLLLRCAALALLAIAFARPLIPGGRLAAASVEKTEVIVALDRSMSMAAGDRWSRALGQLDALLATREADDPVTLVAFDVNADLIVSGGTPQEVAAAAAELRPTARATDYRQTLEVLRRRVLDSPEPRQEVYLLTDLQRQGVRAGEDLEAIPATATVQLVDLGSELGPEAVNLSVSEAEFERETEGEREQIRPFARVRNTGAEKTSGTLDLSLDGRVIASQPVEIEPFETQRVDFDPFVLEQGKPTRADFAVRAERDVLAEDDAFTAVLEPLSGISVLLVEAASRRRASSLYLERALSFSRSPRYRTQRARANALSSELLDRSQVVLLHDSAGDLGDSEWELLERFVQRGGGVLVALGANSGALGARAQEALDLFPMTPANRNERQRRRLAVLDYGHPILGPFEQPRSGDFQGAVFYLRHGLEPRPSDRSLARFDEGSPVLVEVGRAEDSGRVLVWGTSLDTAWNDLPLQPVFLPFVHRMVSHLAGFAPPPEAYRVGQIARFAAENGDWLVLDPSGGQAQTLVDAEELLVSVEERGIYELRPVNGEDNILLAANPPLPESDLTRLDPEEFLAGVSTPAIPDTPDGTAASPEAPADDEGLQFWWLLLAAAALLLVLESHLAARRSARLREPGLPTSAPTMS